MSDLIEITHENIQDFKVIMGYDFVQLVCEAIVQEAGEDQYVLIKTPTTLWLDIHTHIGYLNKLLEEKIKDKYEDK